MDTIVIDFGTLDRRDICMRINGNTILNSFSFRTFYTWNGGGYIKKVIMKKIGNYLPKVNKYKADEISSKKHIRVLGSRMTPYYGKVKIR